MPSDLEAESINVESHSLVSGAEAIKVEVLCQKEEFKYLGVLFKNEGKMLQEINRWMGAPFASTSPTCHKEERAKLIDLPFYLRSCPHLLWVVSERLRSQIKAVEISLLRRVPGLPLKPLSNSP